jgi:Skp family chaperone for outer membrane proteins
MVKDDANINKPAGDVDSNRKILFGDQVAQIEEKFASIEKSITQLRIENQNLRKALEAEITMREQSDRDLSQVLVDKLKVRDATQTSLVKALQQALDQYKKKIESLDKSEK